MKKEVNHSEFGKIVYEESFWSGKKKITINGKPLIKISKTSYKYASEEESFYVSIIGNFLKGVYLRIKERTVLVCPSTKWYEYVIGFLPLALVLVWGNSAALCSIVPLVGGAIGGAIGGVVSILSIIFMKEAKNILFKVLIGIASLAVCFLICFAIGSALVSLI